MKKKPIQKLLIANRGEIAYRITRTARKLGIGAIVLVPPGEETAPHTALAEKVIRVRRDQFLSAQELVSLAKTSQADAIHPGYGFLSEDAKFAEAVEDAGIRFVGPTPESMRVLGGKHSARKLAKACGVPISPGYDDDDQSEDMLLSAAKDIGFPLLIKAVGGGGGRGMRRINEPTEFIEQVRSAKREAGAAFGDDRVFLERLQSSARHVEIQIIGDGKGNVIHLFDRDCTIQRRYQKVIEESLAPGLSTALRERLYDSALRIGKAAKLRSASTVEFLVFGREDYVFLEVNCRLQVEHPVTEEITGLDLVELQLRVAAGEPLNVRQEDIRPSGHAIEARVCAEIPERDFSPATGRILALRMPDGVRIESALVLGQKITTEFDPMLAKIIARGDSRDEACTRLHSALLKFDIAGIETNTRFLAGILKDAAFVEAAFTTDLLGNRASDFLEPAPDETRFRKVLAAALIARLGESGRIQGVRGFRPEKETSGEFKVRQPVLTYLIRAVRWNTERTFHARIVQILGDLRRVTLEIDGARVIAEQGDAGFLIEGELLLPLAKLSDDGILLWLDGSRWEVRIRPEMRSTIAGVQNFELRSHLPGIIRAIHVKVGDTVAEGQKLMTLESMKMEHLLTAASHGIVSEIFVGEGRNVNDGDTLCVLSPEGEQSKPGQRGSKSPNIRTSSTK